MEVEEGTIHIRFSLPPPHPSENLCLCSFYYYPYHIEGLIVPFEKIRLRSMLFLGFDELMNLKFYLVINNDQ